MFDSGNSEDKTTFELVVIFLVLFFIGLLASNLPSARRHLPGFLDFDGRSGHVQQRIDSRKTPVSGVSIDGKAFRVFVPMECVPSGKSYTCWLEGHKDR